jgi:outer membrane protein assembly factor BamB
MGPGPHSISLTVVDDMQETQSSISTIVYDEPQTPQSLTATLQGDRVNLVWAGPSDEYRIYRSTTPISSVVGLTMFDDMPVWGEPVPSPLIPIGSTTYQEWSEPVPVATTLYYVVTSVVNDQEIVWVVDGQNHVSVDATSIASENLESTEEATPLASVIISGIMISLGVLSLIFAFFEARRKSE